MFAVLGEGIAGLAGLVARFAAPLTAFLAGDIFGSHTAPPSTDVTVGTSNASTGGSMIGMIVLAIAAFSVVGLIIYFLMRRKHD